ncbi:UNVERIFIED_CONTAM: hypothetical protein PYX00_008619 [Menopon gallinae]|uniref:Armadillo repeat-containing protein 1 n=1 Tax=Menopon gallinae TaxID=328185 RepID=A0AAW2HQA9_9NEOP
MDEESEYIDSSIATLLEYKELASDSRNHLTILKDKAVLDNLAIALHETDEDLLNASLDTIELLGQNSSNRSCILETFGVVQSLDYLAAKDVNNAICVRAKNISDLIKTADNNIVHQPNKTSRNKKVLILHVFGLHYDTRKELEDILTKRVKCTVTAYEHLDPKLLASALTENTTMKASLVSKNKLNQEILISLNEDTKQIDLRSLPAYLEEKESPVQEKAVRSIKEMRIVASEWFSVAAGILQGSFYW